MQKVDITCAVAEWIAVGDGGVWKLMQEQFAQAWKTTDVEVVNQARRSGGEWRRSPNGDAFRLTELVSVTRYDKGIFGDLVNPRVLYQSEGRK